MPFLSPKRVLASSLHSPEIEWSDLWSYTPTKRKCNKCMLILTGCLCLYGWHGCIYSWDAYFVWVLIIPILQYYEDGVGGWVGGCVHMHDNVCLCVKFYLLNWTNRLIGTTYQIRDLAVTDPRITSSFKWMLVDIRSTNSGRSVTVTSALQCNETTVRQIKVQPQIP